MLLTETSLININLPRLENLHIIRAERKSKQNPIIDPPKYLSDLPSEHFTVSPPIPDIRKNVIPL